MPQFALTLRHCRQCTGLSQGALARRACVDPSDVHRPGRSERRPPPLEVALARALELSPEETSRLLWSAGLVPPAWQALDPGAGALVAGLRLLADPALPASDRTDFCLVVQALARRWTAPAGHPQVIPAHVA